MAHRRYLPDTNVLETTFTTPTGVVRVTDVMNLPGCGLDPARELARRVEGLAGRVLLRWRVEPRFGYGLAPTRLEMRGPYPVALRGSDALAVCAWDAGPVRCDGEGVGADFEIREGMRSTIALVAAHAEPLVFPARAQTEARAAATVDFWRRWAAELTYDGPWRDAVVRSALAPFLLGTAYTDDRTRARVVGYGLHFVAGLVFALVYSTAFSALGRSGWALGMLFGLVHALFAGTTLVNVLLPAVHPRMGTPVSAANSSPLLEPPGFMLLNYGRATPAVTIVAHLAYGAIVGWFIGAASR